VEQPISATAATAQKVAVKSDYGRIITNGIGGAIAAAGGLALRVSVNLIAERRLIRDDWPSHVLCCVRRNWKSLSEIALQWLLALLFCLNKRPAQCVQDNWPFFLFGKGEATCGTLEQGIVALLRRSWPCAAACA